MEKRGKVAVTVVEDVFVTLAKGERKALGMPSFPLVVVPHHNSADAVRDQVRNEVAEALPKILEALTQSTIGEAAADSFAPA
ncbi:MAG: hypothetical protein HY695_29920 [Deltaproteobacteria bacterium]|nr:hypothetical protein [Deltaproteobacteria bacterium]